MATAKKRCKFCHKWFIPDSRTEHQTCCSTPKCRKKRKAQANKNWRLRNPNYDRKRILKKHAWAQCRGYWRAYRREHPAYRARDNQRRRNAYRRAKFSANQDKRREIAVDKLRSIRDMAANLSANQDMMPRRVEGILEYLFWKESSANRNDTDSRQAREP